MQRNDYSLSRSSLNQNLLAHINPTSNVFNQQNNDNKPAILKQLLERTGKKSSSKMNESTSKKGNFLQLVYSLILFTGWLGSSWTNEGVSSGLTTNTTRIQSTSTNSPFLAKTWKYNCPIGHQGKYCDGYYPFIFILFFRI